MVPGDIQDNILYANMHKLFQDMTGRPLFRVIPGISLPVITGALRFSDHTTVLPGGCYGKGEIS